MYHVYDVQYAKLIKHDNLYPADLEHEIDWLTSVQKM